MPFCVSPTLQTVACGVGDYALSKLFLEISRNPFICGVSILNISKLYLNYIHIICCHFKILGRKKTTNKQREDETLKTNKQNPAFISLINTVFRMSTQQKSSQWSVHSQY